MYCILDTPQYVPIKLNQIERNLLDACPWLGAKDKFFAFEIPSLLQSSYLCLQLILIIY